MKSVDAIEITVTMEQTASIQSSFTVTAEELERISITKRLPGRIMDVMIDRIETMEPCDRDLDYCVQDDQEKMIVAWN